MRTHIETCNQAVAEDIAESFGGIECCLYATALDLDKIGGKRRNDWIVKQLHAHGHSPTCANGQIAVIDEWYKNGKPERVLVIIPRAIDCLSYLCY